MDDFLRCRVGPGLFSGEFAVRGAAADGAEFSLFVADDFVECDSPVTGSGPVDGWLRVEVLAREAGLMLVRLPGQTFENGQTVTVRESEIEHRAGREPV